MSTGRLRNCPCDCGSGKKRKKCCKDFPLKTKVVAQASEPTPEDLKEVLSFFADLERDRQILRKVGIHESYQQVISRIKEGYLMSLEKGIFKIISDEALNFYEVIGVVAMETLGDDWIEKEGKKSVHARSEIYKIMSILGATGGFKKIISYTGRNIDSYIPENGFSKNFLTLAFDIFCLRHVGNLPKVLVERLKHFDQYQGARYEIAVAAIFCRLGYRIEWLDDRKLKIGHPEFIARKAGKEVYVEAKSRHLSGVHNKPGTFDESKAIKSKGYGGLLNDALAKEKSIPSGKPYIIFIDINAVNDSSSLPKWIKQARNSLTTQHLKEYLGKKAPFTSVIFTNYSYHYQGLNRAEKGVCFVYENDLTSRPYFNIEEKTEILDAILHYGFIPDYYIPAPITMLQKSSEYPRINNIGEILRTR